MARTPMLHVVAPAALAEPAPRPAAGPATSAAVAVACAARPSTRFAHRDGPCCCFFGGPAPELVAPSTTILHNAS